MKKKLKRILSLLIIISYSYNSYAQGAAIIEAKSFSTELFNIITKLDDGINEFFTKQKADNLNRNLQYFKNDLTEYLQIRKRLMDSLEKVNYNINDKDIKKTVIKLKEKLANLSARLNTLGPMVDSNLSTSSSDIIYTINEVQISNKILYLTELENLIEGKNVDKEKLKKDGKTIYNELLASVGLISSIQLKLQTKFNL